MKFDNRNAKAYTGPDSLSGTMPRNGVTYLPAPDVGLNKEELEKSTRRVKKGSVSDLVVEPRPPFKPETPVHIFRPMRVIILNGPPGCGKDTLAELVNTENPDISLASFKKPMFSIAIAAAGVTEREWFDRYNDRELKDAPWDKLGGLSQRKFMIMISEEWIKPVFGKNHFGKLAARQCDNYITLFTDGGFVDEVQEICEQFGKRNVTLVHVYREDVTFEGDSRSYVQLSGVNTVNLQLADGDIEGGKADLEKIIKGVQHDS